MDMPHAYKYNMYATSRSTRADPDATYSKLPLQEKIATLSGQTKTELVVIYIKGLELHACCSTRATILVTQNSMRVYLSSCPWLGAACMLFN